MRSKVRNIDLHLFNVTSSTAKALFSSDDYQLDRFNRSTKKAHIVLIGDGLLGKDLLRHCLQLSIFEEDAWLDVDVLWPDGRSSQPVGAMSFPVSSQRIHLMKCSTWNVNPRTTYGLKTKVLPTVRFHDLPVSSKGLPDWFDKFVGNQSSVTTVIVAINDPSNSCDIVNSIGEKLSSLTKECEKNIELWVYFNSRNVDLRESFNKNLKKNYSSLCPKVFSDYLDPFSRELAVGRNTDAIAKRVNAMHALSGIENKEKTSAQEKIDSAWKDIGESDKESSRLCAVHASIKKRIRERLNESKKDEESSRQSEQKN